MLTKWAKSLISYAPNECVLLGLNNYEKAAFQAKTCSGNTIYTSYYYMSAASKGLITSFTESGGTASTGFAVGSGNTPATDEDYNVETLITDLTLSTTPVVQSSYDTTTGKYSVYVELSLSNATANDIIVKEIARFAAVYATNELGGTLSASNPAKRSVMVDRTVLNTPVTIPAGQSGLIRYAFVY